MEELTYDYLHGSDIYVYQRKDMFRINTDTALLAQFMKVSKGDKVLDIGTNNGALLLAAHRFHPSFLYGVDIQEEAIELAQFNMQHFNVHDVQLICGDINKVKLPTVDVIVCNPPYFQVYETSNQNESEALRIARHENYLTLHDLCLKASSLLHEKGRLYLVHRSNRIGEIISELRSNCLEVRTLQFVFDLNKKEAVSVLIEAVKDGKVNAHVLPQITIER